ncbi:MAG: CaiB/BaiF CoA-transferase family protein, partial [Bauldia litoralis]
MGPLEGIRIVELAGIGPAPMACMLLSDLGADVLRIDRLVAADLGVPGDPRKEVLNRGRRSAAVDLKNPEGVETVLRLAEKADVLIEGFRPGVTERMGLGPEVCHARNPGLVYGRMTDWGQDGPLAHAAGHDLNYIALTGALHAIGPKDSRPVPPLNLVGDFGGGALYLVVGVLAALLERSRSGRGQVVDAAMVDGAASLMAVFYGLFGQDKWRDARGTNLLDGAAHFYDTYETADGKYVSIAPIEGRFYTDFLKRIGLDEADLPGQHDEAAWPALREKLAAIFRTKSRDEWCDLLEGTDACFAPVLGLGEAPDHPHNRAREIG